MVNFETLSECTSAGNIWTYKGALVGNNTDYDDSCFCTLNNSSCIDLCGQCTGDTIIDTNCIEDCSGFCLAENEVGELKCFGGSNHGLVCTSDIDCPGVGNGSAFFDSCEICSNGNTGHLGNTTVEICSDTLFNTQATCEAENFVWSSTISGIDVGCDGVCNSGLKLDDCGVCGGENLKDSKGNCAYIVHPGDTDMDGTVNINDIAPIVRYWGNTLWPRDKKGIDWSPQDLPTPYSGGDECLAYADANGDGSVNIIDVAAVYVNLSKSHSYNTVTDCSSLMRYDDIDFYSTIYESLPPGEIRDNLADIFNFDLIPDDFKVFSAFPNPFNPRTNLKYQVPSMGDVNIMVFNLQGKIVDEVNQLQINPGFYDYNWNGSNYSSGIYLIHVYFNGELFANQKLVLIK